jgi:riboflavin biosynthesis pyrimidine reductase
MSKRVLPASLATLFAKARGSALPLPPRLARLYGEFRMPVRRRRALVFSNFVSTLDGVVSLKVPGHEGGGDISGFNAEDRMVMGLLRAVSDVVIVGSGTVEGDPHHMWTGAAICPELATDYARLRRAMGKREPALKVVITLSGRVDLALPGYGGGARHPGRVLVLTSPLGAKRLARQSASRRVDIRVLQDGTRSGAATLVGDVGAAGGAGTAAAILEEVTRLVAPERVLVEGGPLLVGSFYAERLLDEQFLTLSPQLAGRELDDGRIGFVMGRQFAPRNPRWATLTDVRRGSSHLFLRYLFDRGCPVGADRHACSRRVG